MSFLKDIEPIKTRDFLKGKFQEYYRNANITLPPRFTAREWGFLSWEGGIMNRHQKFRSVNEVKKYLIKAAPAHSYHSVAYYKDPGKNTMIDKEWMGADLIFDLDADHLPEMEEVKKGKIPFSKLMDYIREQTYRLVVDVLLGDFGLNENDLLITFSGGRGYHVHVRTPDMLTLPSGARREIADYLTGKGLDLNKILIDAGYTKEYPIRGKGVERKNIGVEKLPKKESKGWQGIITRYIHQTLDSLRKLDKEERKNNMEKLGLKNITFNSKNTNEEIFNKMPKAPKKRLVRIALKETAIHPDEPVTGDIHRLIRLPGSLHGGSGLKVTVMDSTKLETFDPMKEATAFGDDLVKVRSIVNHPVTMGDGLAKLKPNSVVELPEKVAIYFMARKWAHLVLET
ncbi:MAG: DNA primase catalytic subunit PriS [Candidatus Poseidoniia archaeon]|jgi:DNA primase small subunit|nr:DNA primase catalytic subunit PriS [Candidatus Poseidoniia archaeon]|tara:strand:+ start:315 stop:1511 length:1197 start_codon:yes stop_codon:yes gene_type:complete